MPDTSDLNFLAEQSCRILDEVAAMRKDMARLRDNLNGLKDALGRLEPRITALASDSRTVES